MVKFNLNLFDSDRVVPQYFVNFQNFIFKYVRANVNIYFEIYMSNMATVTSSYKSMFNSFDSQNNTKEYVYPLYRFF